MEQVDKGGIIMRKLLKQARVLSGMAGLSLAMVLALSLFNTPAMADAGQYAGGYALTKSDPDYSGIHSLIPEMEKWAENSGLSGVSISDDDLENGIRVYSDFDPSTIKSNSLSQIRSVTAKGDYIWEIPVSRGRKTYTYTVGFGMPLSDQGKKNLSEADQKAINEDEGKLKVYSFGEDSDIAAAVRKISASGAYDSLYVVAGIPGQIDMYVLGIKDGHAASFVPVSNGASSKEISWQTMCASAKKARAADSQISTGASSHGSTGSGLMLSIGIIVAAGLILVLTLAVLSRKHKTA